MPYTIREVAEWANVPEGFVRQLIAAGALPAEGAGLGPQSVRRARLLHAWTAAGLSVQTILALVDRRALSLAFLDAPVMATPERLDHSYQQLAADRGIPLSFLQALHQSLGFAPPQPDDRAGEDDVTLLEIAGTFRGAGGEDEATLRLLGVYADSLRRIAKAEADYYETNIERRLRAAGLDERRLIEFGTRFGDRIIGLLEQAIFMIYRRHREHIWTEHAINHVEEALDGSGLEQRVPQPPAICFVDLTGYTQLTEERGDAVAAHVAGRLAGLVTDIARRRGGRPVRWLATAGCSTSGSPAWPCSPGSTSSSAPPRPACRRPTSASTAVRSSPRTATSTDGRSTWPPGSRPTPRRAGGGQRGHRPTVRPRRHPAFPAPGTGRAEGRRQTPGAVPGA